MFFFHTFFSFSRNLFFCAILTVILSLLSASPASAVDWVYNPPHTGRILDGGGWMQMYTLGTIQASTEFTFPLQLVYLNTRENDGLFGLQWFCPQLESSIVPRGAGTFIWETPSGSIVVFQVEPGHISDYFDSSRQWYAKYDSARRVVQIRNQEGWLYEYSHTLGHLLSVTSPTNRKLLFTWGSNELQDVQIQDGATGQRKLLLQAAAINFKKIRSLAMGNIRQSFLYQTGHDGRLGEWLTPTNGHFVFDYAPQGILKTIKDPTGDLQTFVTKCHDPKFANGDSKNTSHWQLEQDSDQKYTFAPNGTLTVTSGSGVTVDKDADLQRGVVTEIVDGGAVRTTYYYRAPGLKYDRKLRRVEENGKVLEEYFYDHKTGLLSSIRDEHGNALHFDYPEKWKPTPDNPWDPKPIRIWKGSAAHPQVIASYEYDASGHVLSTKDPHDHVTRYTYDKLNQLVSVINPLGITTAITYDLFGRPVNIQTGSLSESVTYDDLGRIKSKVSPDGIKTDFEFDSTGNTSRVSRNGKVVTEYIRDDKGRLTGIRDALGRLKKIESDSKGHITAEYSPDGSCTKYEYDLFGRRIAQIDGNGNRTTFFYDPAGHLSLQTNPLGETIKWVYDKMGHLLTQATEAQMITHTYDIDDQLTSLDYGSDERISYRYDKLGRMISASTRQTSITKDYDVNDNLAALDFRDGGEEQLLRYRLDSFGRRTGLLLAQPGANGQYDVLQQTEYAYDNQGRLSSITSFGQPVVTYQYDAKNCLVKKTFGDKVTADIAYDNLGRFSQMTFSGGPIKSPITLAYTWDDADQVIRRSWNGSALRYEYTLGGQLARVLEDKTGNPIETYTYDKAGNMIEKIVDGKKTTMTYNADNELTASTTADPGGGTVTFKYDRADRLVSTSQGTENTYGWLDKITRTTAPGSSPVALTYWPDGQLAERGTTSTDVKKAAWTPGADADHFLWDGLALLRRDDTLYITEPHSSGGVPIASHPLGKPEDTTYYLNDLLGTTLAVLQNGNIRFNDLTSFGQPPRPPKAETTPPTTIQAPAPAAPPSAPSATQ